MTAVDALDRRGLRLAALEAARAHLAGHPDPDLAAFARGILARLLRGPVVTLAVDGRPQRVALGDVVTIGRTGAALPIASPLASRLHLRLYRRGGVAMVEDPGSHNGTFLAGARLSAPIPIGAGLDLLIGGGDPRAIREEDGAVAVHLAGERTLAPLGPLALGGVLVARVPHGDDAVVTLTVRPGSLAWLGDEAVVTAFVLSRGDPRAPPGARRARSRCRLSPAAQATSRSARKSSSSEAPSLPSSAVVPRASASVSVRPSSSGGVARRIADWARATSSMRSCRSLAGMPDARATASMSARADIRMATTQAA